MKSTVANASGGFMDREEAGLGPGDAIETLRESEERYRATFDLAAVGISHIGLDGRWIRFNDAVCGITGYSREELSNKTFADITHAEDVEHDWMMLRRLVSAEVPKYALEKRYIRKDGSVAWVNVSVSLFRDHLGAPRFFIVIIQDIGERKRVEAALIEKEKRLRGVLESMPDAFMAIDRDWRFTYVNSAWENTLGFSRADVLGRYYFDVFPAARGTNVETEFLRAVRERIPVEFETCYEPWQRWFLNRAYPNDDGGVTNYARDVTRRRAVLLALEESEERYRSLVLATSAFVWTANGKGEFEEPQPSWEAYTGQKWDEYRGMGWVTAAHPEERARVVETWRQAVDKKSIYEVEWRAWHAPSGQWRHCITRAVPVFGAGGEVREWIGAVTDVHERKLVDSKLQHDDKLDSLGVLAGGMAHDFNNLLVGILGNASLALEDASPRARPLLEQVVKASERAADLTRQMLAYAGKGQLFSEAINLSEQVRQVIALVRSTLGPAAHVEAELAEDLPPVLADRGQMQQIALNLLVNAGEALEERGGVIRVKTEAVPAGNDGRQCVVLTVGDTGVGMTPEVQSRIFDPFFSTKFTGRGLGLAAVMGIVRAHKGTIEVTSAPGKGTTFRVILPAHEPAEGDGLDDPAKDEETPPPLTVLAIDDEEVVLTVIKNTLAPAGLRVLSAASGRGGVEVFEKRADDIDLVILDATMPDLGGREVLRIIRGIRPDIPVIVSSGHPVAQVERYFGDDAPSAVLAKPYKPATLRQAVAAHAGKRRALPVPRLLDR